LAINVCLVDQSEQESERGSQDRAEQLAGGTVEVVGIPACSTGAVRKKGSAVLVGGVGSARGTGAGNSVVGSTVVAIGTRSVVAVGDAGTRASVVVSVTSQTLVAEHAVSGSSGGRGLFNRLVFAVGNGGGTGGKSGGTRRGVVSSNTTGLVNLMVLAGLANNSRPSPVRTVCVGTVVVLSIGGGLGQFGGASVACQ